MKIKRTSNFIRYLKLIIEKYGLIIAKNEVTGEVFKKIMFVDKQVNCTNLI